MCGNCVSTEKGDGGVLRLEGVEDRKKMNTGAFVEGPGSRLAAGWLFPNFFRSFSSPSSPLKPSIL